jgi:hypothetical protein
MGLSDFLGLGGQTEFLTDWDSARDFMIFSGIVNNKNLTDTEKVKLQSLEQDAYDETSGQWTVSERDEIAQYWNYMFNNAQAITTNPKFLTLLASGADASFDTANTDDASGISEDAKKSVKQLSWIPYLLLFGGTLMVFNNVFAKK